MATEIGDWVKRERLKMMLSQAELAAAVIKSRTWISTLEVGGFRPRVEDCGRLAGFFHTPIDEVLAMAGHPVSEIAAPPPLSTGEVPSPADDDLARSLTPELVRRLLEAGWRPPEQGRHDDDVRRRQRVLFGLTAAAVVASVLMVAAAANNTG